MQTFFGRLRAVILAALCATMLAACGSQNYARGTYEAARRNPAETAVGGLLGTAAGVGIGLAARSRPEALLLAGVGGAALGAIGGALGGDFANPPAPGTPFIGRDGRPQCISPQGERIYAQRDPGSGADVCPGSTFTPRPQGAGWGSAVAAPTQAGFSPGATMQGNLRVQNPDKPGEACAPAPGVPARAITSDGRPWVACTRVLAAGQVGQPLPFSGAPQR